MRIEIIKEKLDEILESYPIEIFSVKTKREFGEKFLEILLKGKDINTDVLGEIHSKLFEKLEDGDLDEDYYLELSSMGAEYQLNSLDEINEHLNTYVYVKTAKFELLGTIFNIEGNTITFEYNAKGQFRKMKIEYDEIVEISTRVKV